MKRKKKIKDANDLLCKKCKYFKFMCVCRRK